MAKLDTPLGRELRKWRDQTIANRENNDFNNINNNRINNKNNKNNNNNTDNNKNGFDLTGNKRNDINREDDIVRGAESERDRNRR
jgi:hypothetical protein